MIFSSLDELLEHIKEVEQETITLSKESQMKFSSFIERNNIELDDEAIEAMQYQDIISQQLSATIEAINVVQVNLKEFAHNFIEDEKKLDSSASMLKGKLDKVLEDAKNKKDAFSGHVKDKDDKHEIEFF